MLMNIVKVVIEAAFGLILLYATVAAVGFIWKRSDNREE